MAQSIDRRDFIKKSLLTPAAGALALSATQYPALARGAANKSGPAQNVPSSEAELPMGRIKDLKISRIL
ncbi:MAG: twin-arginine translocation signal domain-containing protein, partial [Planctomycetaceae bacterium]